MLLWSATACAPGLQLCAFALLRSDNKGGQRSLLLHSLRRLAGLASGAGVSVQFEWRRKKEEELCSRKEAPVLLLLTLTPDAHPPDLQHAHSTREYIYTRTPTYSVHISTVD